MFGYVIANREKLSEAQLKTYQSYYCGICHSLRVKHGFPSSFTLSYDMVFLGLVLSSLYEPRETLANERCVQHPIKSHEYSQSDIIDYCADMTVLLAYHKAEDDWVDDKKLKARAVTTVLKSKYNKLAQQYPRQSSSIEAGIKSLSELENSSSSDIDACARCFGGLMREIFVYREDFWAETLGVLADNLGQFIYVIDALVDLDADKKSGNFNPLRNLFDDGYTNEHVRSILTMLIGECAINFEKLPLVENIDILRNILYSGIWTKFPNNKKAEDETGNDK